MKAVNRFLARMIFGMALILFTNQVLASAGVELSVGYNLISAATTGMLGIPGVLLLYGIAGCSFLPFV